MQKFQQTSLFCFAFLFWIALFFLLFSDLVLFLIVFFFCTLLWFSSFSFFYKKYFLVFLCSLGLFLGGVFSWYSNIDQQQTLSLFWEFQGTFSRLEVEILGVQERKEYSDIYQAEVISVFQRDIHSSHIGILVEIPKNYALVSGQVIQVSWKVKKFEDFNGFLYEKFMLSRNLYGKISVSHFTTLRIEKQNFYLEFLEKTRALFLEKIYTIFPKNEAIFLAGILIGARENIPEDIQTHFNNSWLTHFIAVSGFNITLCVLFFTFLLSAFPLFIRIIAVISLILVFCMFVGLGAPVIRAAIMGILGYIFAETGRKSSSLAIVAFAAFVMSLYNPLSLLYDVSFQLSFLAVIGIIYTQEVWKKLFFFLPKFAAIQEAFVLTLSSLVFTLPLMIFQFWQVSFLAPFANVAVTWTIPLAMLSGAFALFLDMISHHVAVIFGIIPWIFLKYDMLVVLFFGTKEDFLIHFSFWPEKYFYEAAYFLILIYIVSLYHFFIKKQH